MFYVCHVRCAQPPIIESWSTPANLNNFASFFMSTRVTLHNFGSSLFFSHFSLSLGKKKCAALDVTHLDALILTAIKIISLRLRTRCCELREKPRIKYLHRANLVDQRKSANDDRGSIKWRTTKKVRKSQKFETVFYFLTNYCRWAMSTLLTFPPGKKHCVLRDGLFVMARRLVFLACLDWFNDS